MFGKTTDGCPLYREPCRKEKCDWWTRLEYKAPQEQSVRWHEGCAVVMNIKVQLDLMHKVMQNTASVDKVATEVATSRTSDEVRHQNFIKGITHSLPPLVQAITDAAAERVNGHPLIEGSGAED